MGRGARTKIIKQNITGVDQKELNDIFGQIVGDRNSLDPDIVNDKYNKLITSVDRISKLMGSFNKSIYGKVLCNDPRVELYKSNINGWIEDCKSLLDNQEGQMVDRYLSGKNHKVVNDCIHMCSKLSRFKKCIQHNDNLSDSFLKSSKTKDLCIFPFCDFDIKFLYVYGNVDDSVRKYIMIFLNMIFNTTYDISQIVVTPDVDIEKLSDIIVRAISESKKMIPRAGKAFRKIEESVEMLKNNFANYYEDFVASKDPSTIITSFLSDCERNAKDQGDKPDLELARQFMRITAFYRKRSAGRINDPRVNQLLDILDANFKMLNVKDDSDEEAGDDSEQESDNNSEKSKDDVNDKSERDNEGQN